jgi:hypothetical protein
MKNIALGVLDIIGMLLVHVVAVVILTGLSIFVWNVGAVGLLPHLPTLEFKVALAVMTGIYVVDFWVKSYLNKIIAYKQQKNMAKLLFKSGK